jgi:inner membrane protein
MDLASHALVGAAIGEVVVGKRIGRRGMAVGAAAALLPDLDVLGHFFLSDARALAFHRGITHSILVALLLPLALAWILRRRWPTADVTWARWVLLLGLALCSHLLLDSLTCYGTGLLEPFSHARVAFDTIFVADPFYTLPLLVCVTVALLSYKHAQRRKRWIHAGLWISTAYLVWTCIAHVYVHGVVRRSLEAQGLHYDALTVTPTPMNSLLWMGYSQDAEGAWIGYYSLLDTRPAVHFHRIARQDSLLSADRDDTALQQLIALSKGNYAITQQGDAVYFNDLRFGMVSSWDSIDSDFALRYNFAAGADNSRPLNRMRYTESSATVFGRLVDRVLGK